MRCKLLIRILKGELNMDYKQFVPVGKQGTGKTEFLKYLRNYDKEDLIILDLKKEDLSDYKEIDINKN